MKTKFNLPSRSISRRSLLKAGLFAGAALGFPRVVTSQPAPDLYRAKGTRINQSVVQWCFKPWSVEELASNAARMGIKSVELVGAEHWPMLKKHGLACAITPSHGFAKGFAHPQEHEECIKILQQRIDDSAAAGFQNVITF